MRYAIISDLHANSQAWTAVQTDIYSSNIDEILCLGDIVGYGPSPATVLEQVYSRVHHFVLGNHDAVVAGRLDPSCFNERAQRLIEWTSSQLDDKAKAFFQQLPYVLEGDGFRCCHGSPAAPELFSYVLEPEDADAVWQGCDEQFVFLGHSHVPGLFIVGDSGVPHWLDPVDFSAEPNKRYIVNVGSVGQPRRQDVRSTYCIFDTESRSVWFHHVPFDIEAHREALAVSDIPSKSAHFLSVADTTNPAPLREMLDFSPLRHDEVTDTDIGVAKLQKAVRSAQRWRWSAGILLLLLAIALGIGCYFYDRSKAPYVELPAAELCVLPPLALGETCLPQLGDIPGAVGQGSSLRHWTLRFSDPEQQSAELIASEPARPDSEADDQLFLRIASSTQQPFSLIASPLTADRGMRFQLLGSCKSVGPITGHVELCLLQLTDASERLVLHYPIENIPEDRWKPVRKSTDTEGLQTGGPVQWILRGQFSGELLLRSCGLKRTK